MSGMQTVSAAVLPLVLCLMLGYGLASRVRVFDLFLEGAKEGITVTLRVLPALVAILVAVQMLQASGTLDLLTGLLAPLLGLAGIPAEVIPLAILRPISGSGSLAIVDYLLSHYHPDSSSGAMAIFQKLLGDLGPDSFGGRVASVMMGSAETTFYTIAIYYGATRVRQTGRTLPAALTGDLVGFIASAVAVHLLFGG